MQHVKRITDPLYLQRQTVLAVPEHQVPGLMNHIKATILLCRKFNLGSMCGPEAGVNFNFFVASNPNPRDPDWDVLFGASYTPVQEDPETDRASVEEWGVDGKAYKVSRWRKIKMTWQYHNGQCFEDRDGEFEGHIAYMAQQQCDRLNGIYAGTSDEDEEVPSPLAD